jgi:hypothetical protein
MKVLPNYRLGSVDNLWNNFGAKPPAQTLQLTSFSRNGAPSIKYALLKNKIYIQDKSLQQLMKRGDMEMEITHVVYFPEDLAFTNQIKYFLF